MNGNQADDMQENAEQSDGITVFRISPMESLMLHRCRTGAISLQSTEISQNSASVAQTTTYTVAMTAIDPSSSFVPISLQRDVIVVHRSDHVTKTKAPSFIFIVSVSERSASKVGKKQLNFKSGFSHMTVLSVAVVREVHYSHAEGIPETAFTIQKSARETKQIRHAFKIRLFHYPRCCGYRLYFVSHDVTIS
ncbi:hypothetical protein ANN_07873 [Periplaneta americana]|uniref:Uncharacterized protein n=1 Tax=Periplaneta americana TaxID=6978 RepID=A0ABQ8T1C7_PERAM|nr:hypothetical protein ANN_07873 [Periplaneta americana]